IDTSAPAESLAITAINTDTGAADFTTSDTTLIVSGTNGALSAGEKIQVSSDGGTTWHDVLQGTSTTWSYDDTATVHSTSFTYQPRIIDTAANVGTTTSQLVTIETGPTVSVDIVKTILSDDAPSSNVIFTFSEGVTGFDISDLSAAHGTLSGFG